MANGYMRREASFAKVRMMQDFFSRIPDVDSFIEAGVRAQLKDGDVHFINNMEDLKAWKQKYGVRLHSSDEDSDCDEESDPERRDVLLLLDEKKMKVKAEKKRLKKQRQKERKRVEKQNVGDNENKDMTSQARNGNTDYLNLKDMASALDSESSNSSDGSGNEEEEGLDLTSSFVTKAAEIARRKLEQKQVDKKKSPVKEESKIPEKTEENRDGKKDNLTLSPKTEDFIKLSAECAMFGNKLAGAGDYKTAIKYFTDAIKYNPTEYRLFGNRAFCFERMQEFEKSLSDAELSLSMSPGWIKGLFRRGRALAGLKRYEEAACAFKQVLEADASGAEATQELMRVRIMQLMEHGYTREQSSNALLIHGSVEEALEALSKGNSPVSPPASLQLEADVTGVSAGLSAKPAPLPPAQDASRAGPSVQNQQNQSKPAPLPPAQDASRAGPSVQNQSKPAPLPPAQDASRAGPSVQNQQHQSKPDAPVDCNHVVQAPQLFPVWVGNVSLSVTENLLRNLFNKVGTVYSLKQLPAKRCAFINFTQQQHCDAAIRRYHGSELMGSTLAVRYPDRIPPGLNISRAAHKANDLQHDDLRCNLYVSGRFANGKAYHHDYQEPYKY